MLRNIKDRNGQLLTTENEIMNTRREYFEKLKEKNQEEAHIQGVHNDESGVQLMPMEEIKEAINK